MGGEFPDARISMIAWVYLNRVSYGTQSTFYSAVQRVYKDWTTYGAGSGVDPTHSATDFRAKRPKVEINGRDEFNSWCANNAQACEEMSSSEISAKMNELVLALSYENALNFYPVSGYQ